MPASYDRLVLWGPRILGILVSLFIGAFALDAFSPAKPILKALPDFAIHLVPALVILALVVASWHREWVGGLGFIGLAVMYSLAVGGRHVDWVLAISGPLIVVGVLFLVSWQHRRLLGAA